MTNSMYGISNEQKLTTGLTDSVWQVHVAVHALQDTTQTVEK